MKAIVNIKEEPESILVRLNEDGNVKFKRLNFHNYFFVKYDDYEDMEFSVKDFLKEIDTVMDNKGQVFAKLILKNNFFRYKVKRLFEVQNIQTYLADLGSAKTFLIQNHTLPLHQDKLTKAYLDIETMDVTPLEKDMRGNTIASHPVLSYAIKDEKGNIIYRYNKARDLIDIPTEGLSKRKLNQYFEEHKEVFIGQEKELLEQLIQDIKQYDLLLAFNGDSFDFPYIEQRCELYDLDWKQYLNQHLDYMIVYKMSSFETLNSYSLENVALHEFEAEIKKEHSDFENIEEVTKMDWKKKTGATCYFDLYLRFPEVLEEYNIQDVHLMDLIEQKNQYLEVLSATSQIAHVLIRDTTYQSRLCDSAIIIENLKRNIIDVSKPTEAAVEQRKDPHIGTFITGGFTDAFLRTLHFDVHAFDYKSHYPTRDITHELSIENYVEEFPADLSSVFEPNEITLVRYAMTCSKDFITKSGNFSKAKYNRHLEKKAKELCVSLSMTELMWKFSENYHPTKLFDYLKEKDYVASFADMNETKFGWRVYPHYLFKREEGVIPYLMNNTIQGRDKTKYEAWKLVEEGKKNTAEWAQKENRQKGLKLFGNSIYGYLSMKRSRHFFEPVAQGITSSARFIIKRTIAFAKIKKFDSVLCDTDSAYLIKLEGATLSLKELEYEFYKLYKEIHSHYNTRCKIMLKNPMTGEKEECNHFTVFEHEKTLEALICVAKKRYYYKQVIDGKPYYATQGGAYKKKDTSKIAAKWQKELCKDILDKSFDKFAWKQKILSLKIKVENNELEEDEIVNYKGLSRDVNSYGQPVIDKNTGVQKLRKSDGAPMFAPIPAHVQVAKRLKELGEEVEVGDSVPFIVESLDGGKIVPVSLKEFKETKQYSFEYYWDRISSPLIEILKTVYPLEVFDFFGECWGLTQKQLERKQKKMEEEFDADE